MNCRKDARHAGLQRRGFALFVARRTVAVVDEVVAGDDETPLVQAYAGVAQKSRVGVKPDENEGAVDRHLLFAPGAAVAREECIQFCLRAPELEHFRVEAHIDLGIVQGALLDHLAGLEHFAAHKDGHMVGKLGQQQTLFGCAVAATDHGHMFPCRNLKQPLSAPAKPPLEELRHRGREPRAVVGVICTLLA